MFADTAFTLSARNSGPDSDNQILHAQFSLRSYAVIAFHLAGQVTHEELLNHNKHNENKAGEHSQINLNINSVNSSHSTSYQKQTGNAFNFLPIITSVAGKTTFNFLSLMALKGINWECLQVNSIKCILISITQMTDHPDPQQLRRPLVQ